MPYTTIGTQLEKLKDAHERELEQAKKEINQKYQEQRKELYEICQNRNHKYDNGVSAIHSGRLLSNNQEISYCMICGEDVKK